jgi:glycosyltransferase involved in cell wall biosynthesis
LKAAGRRARVAVLAFSRIAADTRVLRTIAALSQDHEVVAVGYGEGPVPHAADFIALPEPSPGWRNRLEIVVSRAPSNILPPSAEWLHELGLHHRAARRSLLALRPDVVHANDWPALPAAAAARRSCGARVVYDSHEFATEEHAHSRLWRLVARAYVRALEERHIRVVDAVITVSDGIAEALARAYGLPERPMVLRNLPPYEEHPFRTARRPRHLLFHGLLKGDRGVELLVRTMPLLEDHVLTLRGNGTPGYVAHVKELARTGGAGERVLFEPAVPPGEVITRAAAADIGLFVAPMQTDHNRFALPNKVFEYVMAGLAAVVSDGLDLRRVVERYGCGLVTGADTPEALARVLAAIPDADLDRMKRQALAAARELNWEAEIPKLRQVYDRLVSGNPVRS